MNVLDEIVRRVDDRIDRIRVFVSLYLSPENFSQFDNWMKRIGLWMGPISAVFLFLSGSVVALKTDSLTAFAWSLAATVLFLIVHWCGRAIGESCDQMIANTGSGFSGFALLRAAAVFGIVFVPVLVLYGMAEGIRQSSWLVTLSPLSFAVGIFFLVWFLLHPVLLGFREQPESSPGADALSLYALLLLYSIRLHRGVFAAGLVVGNLLLIYGVILLLRGEISQVLISGVAGSSGVITVFSAALAPVGLYLGFALGYLPVDLLRAVLRIGK